MNIIEQSVKIKYCPTCVANLLEEAARVCTGSSDKTSCIGEENENFVKRVIMARRHYSVLEHVTMTFELTTSRAIANQIVRHRMAAYCQESMRYVKLNKKDGGLPVIKPYKFDDWNEYAQHVWYEAITTCEDNYNELLLFVKPEDARGILPLDTATTLIATWNLRELFHILHHPVSGRLTNNHAQPQVRELFKLLEEQLEMYLPFVYELSQIYKKNENGTQDPDSASA